jgi:hypothetical protein
MKSLVFLFLAAFLAVAQPALAQGTMEDEEGDGSGVLKFDEDMFFVQESAGVAVITVERSNGEEGSVSVQYSTADGSAVAGQDYTAASGTLTWGPGDGSDRTFTVALSQDGNAEPNETVQLVLSNPTDGGVISSERGMATLVIIDGGGGDDNGGDDNGGDDNEGDGSGVLKFDQGEFFALESAGVAVITVERSKGEDGSVSVQYSTSNGSAMAGADYTATSGTLEWGPGDGSSKTFTIDLNRDGMAEGDETVQLALSDPSGGGVIDSERGTATLVIVDSGGVPPGGGGDNGNGEFEFPKGGFQIIEGRGSATITVRRDEGNQGAVTVDYSTEDGSASAGEDYQANSGTLSWGPGDRAPRTFEVPVFTDGLAEGNETVRLILSNPTGGAVLDDGDDALSTLTILDSDGSTAACVPGPNTHCLLGGRFQVEAVFRAPQGNAGDAGVIPVSDNSGLFWFFNASNAEMLVKLLDACSVPSFNRFWVFFAATTNVDFTVTVTDTATGVVRQYVNPQGQAALPVQDTVSFDTCP